MTNKAIGIFGGTFDPVHTGHIALVNHLLKQFAFESIHLIPCYQPAHRQTPQASTTDRLTMLQLAIKNQTKLIADDIEIKRQGVSYTIDTLETFKQQYPQHTLYLIIGADSYLQFKTWHRWQDIIKLANLLVINRPGYILPKIANEKVHFYQLPPYDISATKIRQQLALGKLPKDLLDDAVLTYIQKRDLYSHPHV